jgi:hypothetical protein
MLDKDADALRLLSEPALGAMFWYGYHLDDSRKRERQVERETGVFKHERWPRGWIRHDEWRYLHFRHLSDTACTPPGRTDWILEWLRGPKGGESVLSRTYSQALYGSPAALGSLIMRARESHDAFLEAARVAAESGHKETHGAYREACNSALALFDHLPPAKDEPPKTSPTPPVEQETKAKPGPKTAEEEERQRYRVLLAWLEYQKAWPEWKAKHNWKGIAKVDEGFYLWAEHKRYQLPKLGYGKPAGKGSEWHKVITADMRALKKHLRTHNLTLEEYAKDLRTRGVL